MDLVVLTLTLVIGLFALLGSGVWVAMSLFGVALIAIAAFTSTPVGPIMSTTVWGSSNSWELAALPMFIWMGEILFRSRLSEDMFSGLAPWITRLPGRLMHVNILGCGIFAAVSGSSAATAATIGKMAIPELQKRGYDEKMMIGTLAGSGTLGLLIPPSIILIVYGVGTDQSIARLFIAGVIPGIMLVTMFMGYVVVWSMLNRDKVPPADIAMTLMERIYAARSLIPVVLLIAGVIGTIYTGFASPTEAAAVGVVLALVLSSLTGSMSRETFVDALMGATKTSCMIAFILAGAAFLTVAMGFTGVPRQLAEWISSLQLSPYMLLFALTIFFMVLGCFLDGISVVVLTTSVILPMVEAAGLDLIWFGIYIVIVVEMSQITPPVGFNLFVLQALTGKNILYVARCALPFFLLLVAAVGLVVMFPGLATWLPEQMAHGG
jgi:tripartite ATP-independent transporter DctM subunit